MFYFIFKFQQHTLLRIEQELVCRPGQNISKTVGGASAAWEGARGGAGLPGTFLILGLIWNTD